MTGTAINVGAVIVGGIIGTLLGDRLPARTRETVMHGLGLVTILVGLQMALRTDNVLIVMGSVLVGGVLGEAWRIDDRLEAVGHWFETRLGGGMASAADGTPPSDSLSTPPQRSISRAFVTASLVFCVGPLTVLGAIQDGLTGDYGLLAIKSVLDGFTGMAFAAAMGPGVLLSTLTILVYQGGLSLAAKLIGTGLMGAAVAQSPPVVEMTATGGVLIIGIALVLLELKPVRVANFLPAIGVAPLAAWLVQRILA
jgi:uncharacterized membrane protein YqgA involved in biofilm formation